MSSRIIIYGGGGHAKVVLDVIQQSGQNAEGVIDNKFDGDLLGIPRYREIPAQLRDCAVIVAIGDNKVRKQISAGLNNHFINVVHPSAMVSAHATVGTGNMLLHRAIVQAGTTIGNHTIINTAAQVDHDCTIGNYVHVAPGAILCGTISIGEGTLVGAGAVIKPGVKIGAWAVIGSGTVVIRDVPDFAVVVGNPGRIAKYTQA
jgi:sugar O-acyltransferase (sialic acid O-acetyltransferase NeuD family)